MKLKQDNNFNLLNEEQERIKFFLERTKNEEEKEALKKYLSLFSQLFDFFTSGELNKIKKENKGEKGQKELKILILKRILIFLEGLEKLKENKYLQDYINLFYEEFFKLVEEEEKLNKIKKLDDGNFRELTYLSLNHIFNNCLRIGENTLKKHNNMIIFDLFDSVKEEEKKSLKLSLKEEIIYNTVSSLYLKGNKFISYKEIYSQATQTRKKDITQQQEEEIKKVIDCLASKKIKVKRVYGRDFCKNLTDFLTLEENLFLITSVEYTRKGWQKQKQNIKGIFLAREPILLRLARKENLINVINIKLLKLTRTTEKTFLLNYLLIKRIENIKNNKTATNYFLFDNFIKELLKETKQEEEYKNDRKKRNKIKEKIKNQIKKRLNTLKNQDYIKHFKIKENKIYILPPPTFQTEENLTNLEPVSLLSGRQISQN